MSDGLRRALLIPNGITSPKFWAEAEGGWSSAVGPWAHGELGARIARNVGAFTYADWTRAVTVAGVGVRVEF